MTNEIAQYFFFKLSEDIYAIEASSVGEMLTYQEYTKVPMMPPYIKGVTNIRGNIITVIDLLQRLGLGEVNINKKTSFVIIDKIALIIDEVHEVNTIAVEDIKSTLDFGFKIEPRFVKNMAKYHDDYIAILNFDEILKLSEISKIEGTL